jgi:hypothetical protein
VGPVQKSDWIWPAKSSGANSSRGSIQNGCPPTQDLAMVIVFLLVCRASLCEEEHAEQGGESLAWLLGFQ